MDPGSCPLLILLQDSPSYLNPSFTLSIGFIIESIVLASLLLLSGFFSGAETAFFAINPVQLFTLKEADSSASRIVYRLLEKPKRLLATLLITVNFINIAIVVISSLMISQIFNFTHHETVGFLIQVVAVTFVIVLFCEVMPKVYATQNALSFSQYSAIPVFVVDKILRPISSLLVFSTSIVDKRMIHKGYDVSMDELTHAIDVTTDKNTPDDEKKILKGIARFGNIDVRQIMKSRMDVIAFDKDLTFPEIFPIIVENKYSRVPVFEGSFDTVIGVLYIKDLLPHLDKQDDASFNWLKLVRPAYFVPESKKINDLLQEFQEKKIHLAIVVDEYGGTSGIATMEDVLEEIVGEINDEFDDDEVFYSKLDDHNYVFEGKTLLNDLCRVTEIDREIFDTGDADVETLAGFILEKKGSIPFRNEVFSHEGILFTIESADRKRIKRVKITLPDLREKSNEEGNHLGLIVLIPLMFILSLSSCDQDYVPKPRGYFRIALPEKTYKEYNPSDCPFRFDIPSYSEVTKAPSPRAEPCWMNIEYPQFRATVYLSYKPVHGDLEKFVEDSRSLSFKHIPKASGIEEQAIADPTNRLFGNIYHVKGSAASSVQFYLTDSTSHFLRGSLYFYAIPNPDSLAPVNEFLSADIDRMVASFRWK